MAYSIKHSFTWLFQWGHIYPLTAQMCCGFLLHHSPSPLSWDSNSNRHWPFPPRNNLFQRHYVSSHHKHSFLKRVSLVWLSVCSSANYGPLPAVSWHWVSSSWREDIGLWQTLRAEWSRSHCSSELLLTYNVNIPSRRRKRRKKKGTQKKLM